jgi:hypothetical protein
MATNGLEFFYFYPREAETTLQPFTPHTVMWLRTAAFSIFGLIVLRFRGEAIQERMNRLRLLTVILAASISLTVLGVLVFPDLVYHRNAEAERIPSITYSRESKGSPLNQ